MPVLEGNLAEAVSRLKERDGNVLIFGSPQLGAWLTQARLIDEFHLVIQPMAAGRGPRMFDGLSSRTFRLLDTRVFGSGVVLARYAEEKAIGRPVGVDAGD